MIQTKSTARNKHLLAYLVEREKGGVEKGNRTLAVTSLAARCSKRQWGVFLKPYKQNQNQQQRTNISLPCREKKVGRCPGFLLAASLYLTTTVIIFAVDSASPRADSSIAAALFDVFLFVVTNIIDALFCITAGSLPSPCSSHRDGLCEMAACHLNYSNLYLCMFIFSPLFKSNRWPAWNGLREMAACHLSYSNIYLCMFIFQKKYVWAEPGLFPINFTY